MKDPITPSPGESTAFNQTAIEADIDRTRSAISADIRAIGEKLSPENLKEEAKHMAEQAKEAATDKAKEMASQVKEAAVDKYREVKQRAVDTVSEKFEDVEMQARRAGDATAQFVRENAIPLALIGIGAGWLIASRRSAASVEWVPPARRSSLSGRTREYRERVRQGMDRARDEVSAVATDTQDRVQGFKEQAEHKFSDVRERAGQSFQEGKERAREFGHVAERRFHEAEQRSREFALDNPFAVGAMALAAGFGIALLLPSTQKENELLGPARDRLIEGARHTAEDLQRTVKQTADDVKSSVDEQLHH